MTAVDVTFEIDAGDGDARVLFTRRRSTVPRVGEAVIVRGPSFGEVRDTTHGATIFEVMGVTWEEIEGEKPEVVPEVHILLEAQDPREPWRPWCVCGDTDREADEDGRCINCNDPVRRVGTAAGKARTR